MTKKSILRPLCGAALVAAAALFAGCSDVYTGGDADSTTVSFAGAEAKYTQPDATGKLESIVTGISAPTSIDQAATDSTVTLTFYAQTRLDEESIEAAVAFYTLTENEISVGKEKVYAYPKRSTVPLTKSLLIYGESVNTKNGTSVTGTARFRVDTSKVDNGLIAVMVDATKLKDKRGNFVLNGDDNETAGEESDSWIDYITVSKDKDGNGYDGKQLLYNSSLKEDFAPPSRLGWADASFWLELTTAGKPTGKYRVIVGPVTDGYATEFAADKKPVYKTELASTLAGIYSVQVKKAGETSWTDKSLTFTYQSGSAKEHPNSYVATTTETLSVGDQIRLVEKTLTKTMATTAGLFDETHATLVYGHPAYASYKEKSYTSYRNKTTWSYHATEPTYIVQEAGDTGKFAADDYDDEDITDAQRSFFDKWKRIGTNKWLVSLEEEILYDTDDDKPLYVYPRFGNIDGFKVVLNKLIEIKKDETTWEPPTYDNAYTELNATITKLDDNRTVLIELPSYYKPSEGTIELWVGSGTTITGNTPHPTQKTFGSFVDVSKGVVSGYVKITDLPTSGTSGSSIWGGSDEYPDGDGGGYEEQEPEPSDDVVLADTTWYGYDYDEGMNISITIKFYSDGRFSANIDYSNDYGSYPDYISGTYDVWENDVYLHGDDDEWLNGYVNENSMTLTYNGKSYTLSKQD